MSIVDNNLKNIKIEKLLKRYGENQVLNSLDVEFIAGKISCIMGESGVGKTTLLRIIMGLEKMDSGSIYGIDDNTRFSVVFQEDRLCENLSSFANVEMVCSKHIKKETIVNHLKMVLPENAIFQKISELSGGMRQRVAIVRAMLAESEIVIMDEPFKGLDKENKINVMNYIKTFQNERTVLVVTHNQGDAQRLEAQICLLTKQ